MEAIRKIKRRLTEAERDALFEMADAGKRAAEIGRKLGLPTTVVYNVMLRNGYVRPVQRDEPVTIMRLGRPVRLFTREEDRFIAQASMDGITASAIARRFAARFGYDRRRNSIEVRLAALATLDDNGIGEAA